MKAKPDFQNLEVSITQVQQQLSAPTGKEPFLVDVREAWELGRGVLPNAHHRPLSTFIADDHRWPADARPIIIYCEHGVRSLDAALWLRQHKNVPAVSMHGGFAEWDGPVQEAPTREEL